MEFGFYPPFPFSTSLVASVTDKWLCGFVRMRHPPADVQCERCGCVCGCVCVCGCDRWRSCGWCKATVTWSSCHVTTKTLRCFTRLHWVSVRSASSSHSRCSVNAPLIFNNSPTLRHSTTCVVVLRLVTSVEVILLFMVTLCNRADHYIFVMLFLLLSFFFFFPRLISPVADWMSAILPHMVWP